MLISLYYPAMFAASLALTLVYVLIWKKHSDLHISLVFLLIPISNLGNLLLSQASSREAALVANAIYYLGGCFLQLMILLAILGLCKIRLNRWVRMLMIALSTSIFVTSLTAGRRDWFYSAVDFEQVNGIGMLVKQYGPLHTLFYAMIIIYFLCSVGAIVYSFLRKKQISRKNLILLFLPEAVCMAAFFLGRKLIPEIELIPAAYVFSQAVYLLIAWRLIRYDVTDSVAEAMAESGEIGFIIFDRHLHYLGSNETARRVLPALNDLTVDLSLKHSRSMAEMLLPWLKQFQEHPEDVKSNGHLYPKEDQYYLFTVGTLGQGKSAYGYRMVITDDTLDQENIRLLDFNNTELEKKVKLQTQRIEKMNDNLVLSMAVMVESRDNSTGGHIRRTSDVVRMLLDVMREHPAEGYDLSEDFCRMLIKAAPMHDLGKIAVRDDILRKPGKFSPEEYEIMKTHAAEGGRIVHEILKGTEDVEFHHLAENVARHHHERWDGTGYPDGLKGEAIPREARIMAIADVYDALVSKRVYKESMSFEKAEAIMTEGMGSQFDPALADTFQRARPALEEYYRSLPAE